MLSPETRSRASWKNCPCAAKNRTGRHGAAAPRRWSPDYPFRRKGGPPPAAPCPAPPLRRTSPLRLSPARQQPVQRTTQRRGQTHSQLAPGHLAAPVLLHGRQTQPYPAGQLLLVQSRRRAPHAQASRQAFPHASSADPASHHFSSNGRLPTVCVAPLEKIGSPMPNMLFPALFPQALT